LTSQSGLLNYQSNGTNKWGVTSVLDLQNSVRPSWRPAAVAHDGVLQIASVFCFSQSTSLFRFGVFCSPFFLLVSQSPKFSPFLNQPSTFVKPMPVNTEDMNLEMEILKVPPWTCEIAQILFITRT